jgi:integrase
MQRRGKQMMRTDGGKEMTAGGFAIGLIGGSLSVCRPRGMTAPQTGAAPVTIRTLRRPQLSWADFLKLSNVLRGNKRAWLWFATLTGGDYGELLFLHRDDIDLERGTLHIRGTKSRTRDRFVLLHPRLAAHVRTLKLAPDAHILKPWRNRVRNLRQACLAAGLPYAINLKDLRRVYLSGTSSGWGE